MESVPVPVGIGIEISHFAGEWTPASDTGESTGWNFEGSSRA